MKKTYLCRFAAAAVLVWLNVAMVCCTDSPAPPARTAGRGLGCRPYPCQ
ncbi:MAG: hypothetical protein LUE10_04075 [Alistipes sp.]|nr:hypothetical protein [Alistipes sp.]